MRKKEFALNKLFNFCLVMGLLLLRASIWCFETNDNTWGIGVGLVALLFMVIPAIFTPYCYAFDSEGVSLCYVFLPVERYLWKDISAITVVDDNIIGTTMHPTIFDIFFAHVFSIEGENVGKTRFYMRGNIRKSFRTKHLLEKYWDGTITGYLLEDVKKWFHKKRTKKQSQVKAHFTDEIVSMEREVRAETRHWVQPFVAQARQYDLAMNAKYLYVTEDLQEWNSRPQEGYTYTLVAEIAEPKETDEDRIVTVSVDLLYVRLGKNAYRGVKNKRIKEELEDVFSDVLKEISENGIEAYCKEIS